MAPTGGRGPSLTMLMMGMLLLLLQGCEGNVLKAPERYQVLSGPVPVSFSLFNNLSQVQREVVAVLVDLVPPQEGADTEYQDEEPLRDRVLCPSGTSPLPGSPPCWGVEDITEVAHSPIFASYTEAELKLKCGALDRAGMFIFRLRETVSRTVLTQSELMEVKWPPFSMTLPEGATSLTQNISLRLSASGTHCDSLHEDSGYTFKLLFSKSNESKNGAVDRARAREVHTRTIEKLSEANGIPFSYPCQLLDLAGIYQAFLWSVYDQEPLAASNPVEVSWGHYALSSISQTIFPCRRSGVIITYIHPPCSASNDKIHLYKYVRQAESSPAAPLTEVYVAEERAKAGHRSVIFSCGHFHEDVLKYCFRYISFAGNNAAQVQFTLCLPTTDAADLVVDGAWSQWSAWSACVGDCGAGQQTRFRACDNPVPLNGGQFCEGDTATFRPCNTSCKGGATTLPPKVYTSAPGCRCGCILRSAEGKIASSRTCEGSSRWIIKADPGKVIKINFQLFTLDSVNRHTWLKIRDGNSRMSNLLLNSAGGAVPASLKSTENVMQIEYMADSISLTDTYEINQERFAIIYKTMENNSTLLVISREEEGSTMWQSAVTLVGIALCVIIIIVSVVLVLHHRMAQKRKLRKQAAVNQSLLINGEIPNSPSNSGQSVKGSTNVSFGDAELSSPSKASPTKRDYVMARGTSTDPHSPDNVGKVVHGKPPKGRPVEGGRQGSSTASPYAVNAKHGDYTHSPDLLHHAPDSPSRARSGRRHGASRRRGSTSPQVSPHRSSSPSTHTHHGGSKSPRKTSKDSSGAPLADLEDLSPSSPVRNSPQRQLVYPSSTPPQTARHRSKPHRPNTEHIPMDSMAAAPKDGKRFKGTVGGAIPPDEVPDTRPPVEGRDSLTRKKKPWSPEPSVATPSTPGRYRPAFTPTTPDIHNSNYSPYAAYKPKQRPEIKPLPLREIERPDGKSPENKAGDHNANTPSSHGMSPMLTKTALFPETTSIASEFMPAENDFEYDDYVPELPGSYFTMDPHAYTLTWSQRQPWGNKPPPRMDSENSVVTEDVPRGSHC